MKVTRYERVDAVHVVAIVDFYIEKWKLHLRDVRLIKARNGHMFLSLPSKRVGDGEDAKWVPYLEFEHEAQQCFLTAAMKAIDEYVKEQVKRSENQHVVEWPEPAF